MSGDKLFSFDTDRSVFSTNQFSYAQNDPVNEVDYEGRCIAKIIIRAIRSGAQRFLNFIEVALKYCIIKAFSESFEE